MPNYIRARFEGGTYFFTVVTFERSSILTSPLARRILRDAWQEVQRRYPFSVEALCLLPDHLHCIWKLPEGDRDFSKRWNSIKGVFTKKYLTSGGTEGSRNASRKKKGEAAVWQRRFWEHLIRDEEDFSKHFDYIHYNPVKHRYVEKARDWKWSTFHRYRRLGYYSDDWGSSDIVLEEQGVYGES